MTQQTVSSTEGQS